MAYFIAVPFIKNDGYEMGQIDALNNRWKYKKEVLTKQTKDTLYIEINKN